MSRSLNRMALIGLLLAVVGCGGGEGPQKTITVRHGLDEFALGTQHVHYSALTDEGIRSAPQTEFSASGQNLVSLPADTTYVLVEAHDTDGALTASAIYPVSSEGVAVRATSLPRWMTDNPKIQGATLSRIAMPGAHDAGMGKIHSCSTYANTKTTQTQKTSFAEMLQAGIRYFDVRPVIGGPGSSGMRLGHFQWIGKDIDLGIVKLTLRNEGCLGYSMDEVLEDVRAFLASNNNREVVILKMSHFMNLDKFGGKGSHFDQADLRGLEARVIKKLEPFLLPNRPDFRHATISTLTATGPKAIVTFDAPGYDGAAGIYSESTLSLYDEYSDSNNVKTMEADQFAKMDRNGWQPASGPDAKHFVLSWTLTQSEKQAIGCTLPANIGALVGYGCVPLQKLAGEANARQGDIYKHSHEARRYPNVIYVDNAGVDTATWAVAINAMDKSNWR